MADINNNLNSDSVIVKDDELLYKKTQAVPKPVERQDVDTEGKFLKDFAEAGIKGQVDMSNLNSFTHASQSRNQVYDILDSMCEDSTIAAILETYAEDATEYNDKGDIIWCESDDSAVAQFITYLLKTMHNIINTKAAIAIKTFFIIFSPCYKVYKSIYLLMQIVWK